MKLLLLEEKTTNNQKTPKTKTSPRGFSVSLCGFQTVVDRIHVKTLEHIWLFLKHVILKLCLNLSVASMSGSSSFPGRAHLGNENRLVQVAVA